MPLRGPIQGILCSELPVTEQDTEGRATHAHDANAGVTDDQTEQKALTEHGSYRARAGQFRQRSSS